MFICFKNYYNYKCHTHKDSRYDTCHKHICDRHTCNGRIYNESDTWRYNDSHRTRTLPSKLLKTVAEKPPCSTIAGIRTAPRAATVAGPEPEIAPKKQETITHTIAMPPFLCPTQVSTKSISLREIPAFAMIFPDSTKNGIARRRNY